MHEKFEVRGGHVRLGTGSRCQARETRVQSRKLEQFRRLVPSCVNTARSFLSPTLPHHDVPTSNVNCYSQPAMKQIFRYLKAPTTQSHIIRLHFTPLCYHRTFEFSPTRFQCSLVSSHIGLDLNNMRDWMLLFYSNFPLKYI